MSCDPCQDIKYPSNHPERRIPAPFRFSAICEETHTMIRVMCDNSCVAYKRRNKMTFSTYAWFIDKSFIEDSTFGISCDVSITGPGNPRLDPKLERKLLDGDGTAFKLYDDDRNLYYTGRIVGDFEGFEPLDDFGTPNAGATAIKIGGKFL